MEINTLLITQARTGSTRLPGKVMKIVKEKSLLEIHLERLSKSQKADAILIATTEKPEDEVIALKAKELGYLCYRGSENDVLDRFYKAAKPICPYWVVRVTSDCPLIDSQLVDEVIAFAQEKGLDYCTNTLSARYPDGQDIEVFSFSSLEKAWREAKLKSEREHVTPFIRNHSTFMGGSLFTSADYPSKIDYSGLRMTVDEEKDLELISQLVSDLGTDKTWEQYTNHMIENGLFKINGSIIRNEGYQKSLEKDKNGKI